MISKNKIFDIENIIKIIFTISIICYNSFIINYIKKLYNETVLKWENNPINLPSIKSEILSYENFTNISLSSLNLKTFEKCNEPKISIIVPIYNFQCNIINFYLSIYNQSLTDIEIIFTNNNGSETNTIKIIKSLMSKDNRITYISNDNKLSDFSPKKKGILSAKGEYILIIEPDDLLLNNILEKSYSIAKKNSIDILQYYIMVGTYKNNRLWKNIKCNNGIINSPKIEKFFFNCRYFNLLDKLIKREIFIESFKDMTEIYDNDDFYEISDDDLAFFALAKKAKSYGFFEDVGYFYNLYSTSSTGHFYFLKMNKKWDEMFYKLFRTLKYFFEKSKNNKTEKRWVFKFFLDKIYAYRNKLIFMNKNFDYFNGIIDTILKCNLFTKNEKEKLIKFKNMVIDVKNRLE